MFAQGQCVSAVVASAHWRRRLHHGCTAVATCERGPCCAAAGGGLARRIAPAAPTPGLSRTGARSVLQAKQAAAGDGRRASCRCTRTLPRTSRASCPPNSNARQRTRCAQAALAGAGRLPGRLLVARALAAELDDRIARHCSVRRPARAPAPRRAAASGLAPRVAALGAVLSRGRRCFRGGVSLRFGKFY